MNSHNLVLRLAYPALCYVFVASLWVADVYAQTEFPSGQTEAEQKRGAMVRGWLLPTDETSKVDLTVRLADGEKTLSLASTSGAAASCNSGYAKLKPAGAVEVELKSEDKVISTQRINLRPNRCYTFVAWREANAWRMKAFADDLASANAAELPLRVLNFADGRRTEFIVAGGQPRKADPNTIQEIKIAPKNSDLSISVLDPKAGAPSQTTTAFDFSNVGSAYLVIAADYLGRYDMRVITGGVTLDVPPPLTATNYALPAPEDMAKERQRVRKLELENRLAQLAALKASEQGPNKIPNAAEIKREIEKAIKELQTPVSAPRSTSPEPGQTSRELPASSASVPQR
jgi:hypothetical protein